MRPSDELVYRAPRFRTLRSLALPLGRNVIPPSLIRPGPFDAVGYPSTLAAYPVSEFETDLPDGYGPARVGWGNILFLMIKIFLHRL